MEKVALQKICEIGNGFAFKSKEYLENGIPLLRISNISNEKVHFNGNAVYVDENFLETKASFIVEKGDVVIALSGATTGKYGIYDLDYPCLLNQRLGLIKAQSSKELNSRYFYYYLGILRREILLMAGGAAQPNISTKELGRFKIPLPNLKTQQKIAEILDEVDKLRRLNKKLIKKYEQLSQSLFLEMFGDPMSNPKGWEIVTVRDLISSAKYGTSSKASEKGEFPYLRMNNITYGGYMDYTKLKYINMDQSNKHKYLAKKGDILFNRTNSKELVGKTGIFESDEEMILAGYIIRLRANEKANPYFLWSFLNTRYTKQTLFNMCKNIVGMANINAQEVQNIQIYKPPIGLQNKFSSLLQEIENQKGQAQQSLEYSEELFNSLLQRAFKGELVK